MTARPAAHGATPDQPAQAVFRLDVVAVSPSQVQVRVVGELDTLTSPRLGQCLQEVLAGAAAAPSGPLEIVLDLTQVSFLNSAGLTVLANGHRAAGERGHRLRVLAATRAVAHPLRVTGLWQLLAVEEVPRRLDGARSD